jgi:hypothetical protein
VHLLEMIEATVHAAPSDAEVLLKTLLSIFLIVASSLTMGNPTYFRAVYKHVEAQEIDVDIYLPFEHAVSSSKCPVGMSVLLIIMAVPEPV